MAQHSVLRKGCESASDAISCTVAPAAEPSFHGPNGSNRVARAAEAPATAEPRGGMGAHARDEDCTIDPATNCCVACGVEQGPPCQECGGRSFHRPGCPDSDEVALPAACPTCVGGADPDRVLAVSGRCACGAVGALYSREVRA